MGRWAQAQRRGSVHGSGAAPLLPAPDSSLLVWEAHNNDGDNTVDITYDSMGGVIPPGAVYLSFTGSTDGGGTWTNAQVLIAALGSTFITAAGLADNATTTIAWADAGGVVISADSDPVTITVTG